ncbi:flap endonuclease 1 isoform X1 [Rhodamnia argentea]|uniref:Flap endonuclease 1 n=1 Tax=Rhodamnia argentea TaxID=178133 RepID=A0ABM3HTJ4_9MYRT|nr:flap endonuclease 1 isoform X1 [Rhodamnia argentea]
MEDVIAHPLPTSSFTRVTLPRTRPRNRAGIGAEPSTISESPPLSRFLFRLNSALLLRELLFVWWIQFPCVCVLKMGIKGLTKLLADNAPKAMKEQKFESYFGRKISIDASMSIYQFLIVVGRSGTEMLTNEAGEVTSHLQGMFNRTIRLLEAGIKPVYVFDGQPPDLKKQELAKRYSKRAGATEDLEEIKEIGSKEDIEKFSKRTVKVTKQHNEDCKRLLRLMGVPVIEAPSEAEAECAALCKSGKVYAVASEDMDSLTFGAPRFLRHLMDPSSRKVPVMEFEIAKILEELNLNMDQFIDVCILSGCDYCESIRGIGGQTALKLIRQHGSIENILENINKEKYQIPDDWPYKEARKLFKEPLVFVENEEPELKWNAPDEEGLISFLVNENGFNSDRVTKAIEKIKAAKNKSSQGRLESFFKPAVNTSAPIKRKVLFFLSCSFFIFFLVHKWKGFLI